MKCVKAKGQQPNAHNILRCSDQYAKECTNPETGDAEYIPKRLWKQFVRDAKKETPS